MLAVALIAAALAGNVSSPLAQHSPFPDGPSRSGSTALKNIDAQVLRRIAIAEDERRLDHDLKGLINDATPAVRARVALAIGRLQDSTAVPVLTPLLNDTNLEVRREVVFALGQIGHRSARTALESALANSDAETARLAIEALGKLGDKAATPRIVEQLKSKDAQRRGEAAIALWRLADSTALEPLLRAHEDPDAEVRWRVLYALEKIASPQRIVLVAATHTEETSWLVRAYATRTIGRQKATRGNAYLFQRLADTEVPVVVNAIRGIQLVADTTYAGGLAALTRMLEHAHPYVRVSAATALGDRFPWVAADSASKANALTQLKARVADPDPATRGAVARALMLREGDAVLRAVEPVLADGNLYARIGALSGFTGLSPASARELLLERLGPGTAVLERMTAAELLGTIGAREALPRLRDGLADTSALFVAAVAGALEALADTMSIPLLTETYADRAGDVDADARTSIRDALRGLGATELADSLAKQQPAPKSKAGSDASFAVGSDARGAILHTERGDIEIAFYNAEATQTVKNWVRLVERGWFNATAFHRVVPNFVIQDGDPTGTGSGGPGYTIRCEYNRLKYEPGMVGMALSGKDTGGSQWFITHSPQPHLNGRYTIFARVVRGMEVVNQITQGDRITGVDILRENAATR
jgi:cyclophilin family peptidyl-prolyl cis-trans isomerase/HEAT repeat protein